MHNPTWTFLTLALFLDCGSGDNASVELPSQGASVCYEAGLDVSQASDMLQDMVCDPGSSKQTPYCPGWLPCIQKCNDYGTADADVSDLRQIVMLVGSNHDGHAMNVL